METLIGSLTVLIAVLIIAVSFGALALVGTGAALPPLPRRQARRPAASTTIDTTRLTVSPSDENMISPSHEPITSGEQEQRTNEVDVPTMDDGGIAKEDDEDPRHPLPATSVPHP